MISACDNGVYYDKEKYNQLLEDKDNSYYIIMEDDILETCENFKEKFVSQDYVNTEVLFLGYHMFSKNRKFRLL